MTPTDDEILAVQGEHLNTIGSIPELRASVIKAGRALLAKYGNTPQVAQGDEISELTKYKLIAKALSDTLSAIRKTLGLSIEDGNILDEITRLRAMIDMGKPISEGNQQVAQGDAAFQLREIIAAMLLENDDGGITSITEEAARASIYCQPTDRVAQEDDRAIDWPTMPPSKNQSHVLFEDGYAEGWSKCINACKSALSRSPIAGDADYTRNLETALKDCATVAILRGDGYLSDCIDNTGQLYQSQALADLLARAALAAQPKADSGVGK